MATATKKKVDDLPTRQLVIVPPSVPPIAPTVELPQRRAIDVGEPPPPENLLQFPTRNPVAAVPQAEVPLDLPTYTRPHRVNPVMADPPIAPPAGLPSRPRLAFPEGTVEYGEKKLADVSTMPPEKMSRKKAALYGFLRALQSGNLLAGGVGALVGAVAPGATSTLAKQDQVAEATQELDNAIVREARRSEIDNRRALAKQRRDEPLREEAKRQEAAKERERDNLRQVYNSQEYFDPKSNPEHEELRNRAAALGLLLPTKDAKEAVQLEWVQGELKAVNKRTRKIESITSDDGSPVVDPTRQPVVEDGLSVSPGAALNYRGQVRREGTATDNRKEARLAAAAKIAGDVAAANAEASKWADLAARTDVNAKDQTTGQLLRPYYESLVTAEKQKALAKALELSQGYGDIYEAGPGEGGWAYVKLKDLPTRNATPPSSLPTRKKPGPPNDPIGLGIP